MRFMARSYAPAVNLMSWLWVLNLGLARILFKSCAHSHMFPHATWGSVSSNLPWDQPSFAWLGLMCGLGARSSCLHVCTCVSVHRIWIIFSCTCATCTHVHTQGGQSPFEPQFRSIIQIGLNKGQIIHFASKMDYCATYLSPFWIIGPKFALSGAHPPAWAPVHPCTLTPTHKHAHVHVQALACQ